jgi:two-component system chemotaxis response regulator CheY
MTPSVLIVDDSAVSRTIVRRCLPPGWSTAVTHASNGIEALAALAAAPHDVVLLDLNMPIMDGYQFLEALRGSPRGAPIVIVLSGDIQPGAQARVKQLGARAFVKKPVRPESVLDALRECGLV